MRSRRLFIADSLCHQVPATSRKAVQATYEFRVPEKYASRLFGPSEGVRLGDAVRMVAIDASDPRLPQIGELDREIAQSEHETPRYFFSSWNVRFQYTVAELTSAEVLHAWPTSTFEPCGEMCGTIYDESTACPECGAGATQASDLWLDLRKAPRTKDIARTIAGETIVSQRMAEVLADASVRGVDLRPVRHKARYQDDPLDLRDVPTGREILARAQAAGVPESSWAFDVWLNRAQNRDLWRRAQEEYAAMRRQRARRIGKPAPTWYQLLPQAAVAILPSTRTGVNPFDDDAKGEYRCSRGDTIGLNLLSELWLSREDFEKAHCDIASTRQYVGRRSGVLRPGRALLISPRLWRLLTENGLKGLRVEVAHLE